MTDPLSVAETLSRDFARTAVERDRRGGVPKEQRDALRGSGLLTLVVPERLGGAGADWTTTLRTVRVIARADGSLGHVYGFQHLLLATVRLFGDPAQFDALATATVAGRWFWGNALNPLDPRAVIEKNGADRILDGQKSFCSGARDADALIVSGIDPATKKLVVAAIPADRPGVTARGDWDNMGQRQTDSGTVVFEQVLVREREVLASPGPLGSVFASLRPLVAQLSLVNVYLGIAEGAFSEGRRLARERGRAWFASGAERAVEDPYVLASLGDLYAKLEAARYLADGAGVALDRAWSAGDGLTPAARGELAIAVAAAKVIATEVGLDVVTRVFDATGARATAAGLGLDRYWRDLRTHTLHDPVEYKRRDIGRWLLTDVWPAPSFYS